MSVNTIKSIATLGKDKGFTIHADTMSNNGKSVQGRIYLESKALVSFNKDIHLGIYTEPEKTRAIERLFEKHFSNNVGVIKLDQEESFDTKIQIAAKLDLNGLDTSSLLLYSYNPSTNSYTIINNPNYFIDKAGYLHFFTEQAGCIIVTDKPLGK
jgi:hypothetical protein